MTLSNHQILLCFAADFIAVIGYFTAAYYIQFRRERRRVIQAESRERQAKLEAFWKEEQLRLNPPPKPIRISQPPGYIGHNYAIRLTSPNGKTFRLLWSNDAPEDAIIIPDNEPPQLSK